MAATRLIALHVAKGRTVAQSLGERTDYAKNPEKTEKGELVTAYRCDPFTVDEEFMLQKRLYRHTGTCSDIPIPGFQSALHRVASFPQPPVETFWQVVHVDNR